MSTAILHDLQAIFDKLPADKWVRAVVLTGAGHAFCGGHDLYQMHDSQGDKQYFERMFARCSRFMLSIQRVPQPVVAAVNGLATGAGMCPFLSFHYFFFAMCPLLSSFCERRFAR
jgi:enoyl-CoA hydratase/carnithine racemase